MEKLLERFERYIKIETTSNPESSACPSSDCQFDLANLLAQELTQLGLSDVSVDSRAYVMAKLPSNLDYASPAIGFIAHMDSAPDASGRDIKPQYIKNYSGDDIVLGTSGEILSASQYPELKDLVGKDLITTDGTTLLSADDKAGVAEIMTAIAHLQADPKIKHGDIWIGFTPDEEIGRGADFFDVKKFAAEWAYTVDGGSLGELEYENFNAAEATINIHGVNVHPGSAKDKMINAMLIAADLINKLPSNETPATTDGYAGFYHLIGMKGDVTHTKLQYIIRDFTREGLEARKAFLDDLVTSIQAEMAQGKIEIELKDNYYNMREKVEPFPHIIKIAEAAMQQADVIPDIKPIRGGTDGARLSFMGLPCPNLFTGGANFHGLHEYVCVDTMHKAVDVILNIVKLTGQLRK